MKDAKIFENALVEKTMDLAIKDKYKEGAKQLQEMQQTIMQQDKQEKVESDEDDLINELLYDDKEGQEIIQRMKKEKLDFCDSEMRKKKQKVSKDVFGEYYEISEQQFLPTVTNRKFCVVHFYHHDFERCKIIDMHLSKIAINHGETKFVKLDAEKAPFFIKKLGIQMLPTICCFIDGVLKDKITGFEELGGIDTFKTLTLIRRLVKSNAVVAQNKIEEVYMVKTRSKKTNICYDLNDSENSDDY